MKPSRPALVAASAALALTVALTGCADKGSSSNGTDSTSTASVDASGIDAPTVLKDASEAAKNLTSTHFTVAVAGKVQGLPISKVDGDLQIKPATQAQGTALVQPGNAEGKFTFIDGTMYAALFGDKYVDYGDGKSIYDVSVVLNPDKGLANLLRQIQNPTKAGSEQIDGVSTTKITGTVPAAALGPLTGANVTPNQAAPVPVTVWITSDNQLARVVLTPAPGATMTINLSKWNNAIEVTKPTQIVTPSASTPPNPADASRVPA